MSRTTKSYRILGLAVTTALSASLLAGCATASAPTANASASKAEAALAAGKHTRAITHAEAAVLAEPRNAAYRAMLGSAYLDAGRFQAAASSFDDAMQLGDTSSRTVLSLALAHLGMGRYDEAAILLNQNEGRIATADIGLALALAGQPGRGIHIMGNAIRAGDNNAKMRQNLAYAYALNGQWREARLMAEQDVPADKVGDRMEQWAMSTHPDAHRHRIATLLQVPANAIDGGQPIQLALANHPSIDQLAGEAFAEAEPVAPVELAAAPASELPVLAPTEPIPAQAPAPVQAETPALARADDFQAAFSASSPTPAPQAAPVAVGVGQQGTHLVQLGSFLSEQGARRAWDIYSKKYPELAGHRMVISEAVVNGKRYWRVSAGGFARSNAVSMCGRVKARGEGCFAWAEGRPLPGAVDTGIRLARR